MNFVFITACVWVDLIQRHRDSNVPEVNCGDSSRKSGLEDEGYSNSDQAPKCGIYKWKGNAQSSPVDFERCVQSHLEVRDFSTIPRDILSC